MKTLEKIILIILFIQQLAFAQIPPGGSNGGQQTPPLPGQPSSGGTTNPTGGYQPTALPGEGQKPSSPPTMGVTPGQAQGNPDDPKGGNHKGGPGAQRDYSRQDNAAIDYDPNKGNLTDREYGISKQHHEGKAQREYEAECIKTTDLDKQKACAGQEADGDVLGISSKTMGMISKAYVMVVGLGGIGDTYNVAKDPNNPDDKGERKDYCKYIAVGTEAIAMFQQMSAQNNLQATAASPGEHKQIAQLEKAKLSHVERSKTAKIQAYGWGATSVCYIVTLSYAAASGGFSAGGNVTSLIVKTVASGVFLTFAIAQVIAHEKYANKIEDILKNFRTKNGNCNPITERSCYCSEPDTQSDPIYCTPYLHQKRLAASALRISCLNNQLKADPQCNCAQSDTCFDKTFMSMTSGLNFGTGNDPIKKTVEDLARGQITGGGRMNTASMRQNAKRDMANIRGLLDKIPAPNLNASQMAEAKELSQFADIPGNAAAAIAAIPMTAEMQKQLAHFQGAVASYDGRARDYESNSMGKSNVMYFGGGNLNGSKNKKEEGLNPDIFKTGKKSGEQKANFLNFQEKAAQAAQINKRSDVNLFEIISRRYQVTGRRVLEIKE